MEGGGGGVRGEGPSIQGRRNEQGSLGDTGYVQSTMHRITAGFAFASTERMRCLKA